MKFSLVVGTYGRADVLQGLLRSLIKQTHRHFEVVIVDQNSDDRVATVLQHYQSELQFVHLRARPGLSHARNVGLQHISGDVIAFPDDDCWYPPLLLESVSTFFNRHPEWEGLTGRPQDQHGNVVLGRYDNVPGEVTRFNVWHRSNSNTLFVRRKVVDAVRDFDEELGVGGGTPWGAAEDIDFPLRAMARGLKVYYDPDVCVGHPNTESDFSPAARMRAISYGAGVGKVLQKHRYPLWFVIYLWMRPLGGAAIALVRGNLAKSVYHWSIFEGRVRGWLG